MGCEPSKDAWAQIALATRTFADRQALDAALTKHYGAPEGFVSYLDDAAGVAWRVSLAQQLPVGARRPSCRADIAWAASDPGPDLIMATMPEWTPATPEAAMALARWATTASINRRLTQVEFLNVVAETKWLTLDTAPVIQNGCSSQTTNAHHIRTIFKQGRRELAEWCIRHVSLDPVDVGKNTRSICESGDLTLMVWWMKSFGISVDNLRVSVITLLYDSCKSGRIDFVQWLVSHASIRNAGVAVGYNLMWAACANGHRDLAHWITDHFELSADDVCSDDAAIFWDTCISGHLDVAVWLADRFGMTADALRDSSGTCLLRYTCWEGHREMSQWLTTRFRLTAADACADANAALWCATHEGHYDTAVWLIDHFGLTADVICQESRHLARAQSPSSVSARVKDYLRGKQR